MSNAFDPYYEWLGIPPKDQPPNHYRLLGIEEFEGNSDVISNAADRQSYFIRSTGLGQHGDFAQRLLNEVAAARVRLLNSEEKVSYDAQLRWESATKPVADAVGPDRPNTTDEFIREAISSGLLSSVELAAHRKSLPPLSDPFSIHEFAESLIEYGRLTDYQAASVFQRTAKKLVLGEYVIQDEIGSGGMGTVFRAVHRRMKRVVALKVLPASKTESPHDIKRFEREVEAAAKLEHPNIVSAYDAGEVDGIHFLVMQFVEGRDLHELLAYYGPLSLDEALNYTLQSAEGLSYAHSKGMVHRDIKPANLLLDIDGCVRILDMGLASFIEQPTMATDGGAVERLTGADEVMGTVTYMSPEQAADTRAVDHRSDIYSLGCTLYRLLTGHPPFLEDTAMKTLLAHREAKIPSLTDRRPDVPQRMDTIFKKMVAKRPEDRYQNVRDLMDDLDEFLPDQKRRTSTTSSQPITHGVSTGDEPSTKRVQAGIETQTDPPETESTDTLTEPRLVRHNNVRRSRSDKKRREIRQRSRASDEAPDDRGTRQSSQVDERTGVRSDTEQQAQVNVDVHVEAGNQSDPAADPALGTSSVAAPKWKSPATPLAAWSPLAPRKRLRLHVPLMILALVVVLVMTLGAMINSEGVARLIPIWIASPLVGGILCISRRAFYEGFVLSLLFGPLGVAVSFFHDNRRSCPNCNTRLPIGRQRCPKCRQLLLSSNLILHTKRRLIPRCKSMFDAVDVLAGRIVKSGDEKRTSFVKIAIWTTLVMGNISMFVLLFIAIR